VAKLEGMRNLLRWLSAPLKKSETPASAVSGDAPPPPPAFIPENELEEALMEAATNPDRRTVFSTMLLDSDLFAATPDAADQRKVHSLQAGDQLRLFTVDLATGGRATALFTSERRVAEVFGAEVGFVAAKGRSVLELVMNDDAILNPGLGYGVHWTPADIASLLGKPVARTVAKETKLLLGTPAEIPDTVVRRLTDVLGGDGRISEAWLALAYWPDSQESAWYLDLRSTHARDELADMIAAMLKGMDLGGKPLDTVIFPPSHPPGTGIRLKPLQTH